MGPCASLTAASTAAALLDAMDGEKVEAVDALIMLHDMGVPAPPMLSPLRSESAEADAAKAIMSLRQASPVDACSSEQRRRWRSPQARKYECTSHHRRHALDEILDHV